MVGKTFIEKAYDTVVIESTRPLIKQAYNYNKSRATVSLSEGNLKLAKEQLYDTSTMEGYIPQKITLTYSLMSSFKSRTATKIEESLDKNFLAWNSLSKYDKLKTLGFLILQHSDTNDTSDFLKAIHQNPALADIFLTRFTQRVSDNHGLYFRVAKPQIKFLSTATYVPITQFGAITKLVDKMAAEGPEKLFVDYTHMQLKAVKKGVKGEENRKSYDNALSTLRTSITPTNPIVDWTPEAVNKASLNVQESLKVHGGTFADSVKGLVSSTVFDAIKQTLNSLSDSLSSVVNFFGKKESSRLSMRINSTPVSSRSGSFSGSVKGEVSPIPLAEINTISPAAITNKFDAIGYTLTAAAPPPPATLSGPTQ